MSTQEQEPCPAPVESDPVVDWARLEATRRELEAQIEEVKSHQSYLEQVILDRWADTGQTSANIDGMCVYLARDFVCSKRGGVPTEQVCEVLKSLGLADMVSPNYSAATLKSWVKERAGDAANVEGGEPPPESATPGDEDPDGDGDDDAPEGVPDELAKLLNYQTLYRLKARKS